MSARSWSCAVIRTLGELGVVHAEPERPDGYLPAPEVQPADTTGAGDAFVGSLAVLLAIGDQMAVAAERAVGIALPHRAEPRQPGVIPDQGRGSAEVGMVGDAG
jgi:fructose-1-phosphate kinase PfkB-like protein